MADSILVKAPASVYALSFDICRFSSDTIFLSASPFTKPIIEVVPELLDCASNSYTIRSKSGIVNWNTGEVSDSIKITAPTFVFAQSLDSCRIVSDTIYLEENKTPVFPNVITVNFDGLNDYLSFNEIKNPEDFELILLNRWGREVYRSNKADEKYYAEDVASGVYFYKLTFRDCNWKLTTYLGTLNIIK